MPRTTSRRRSPSKPVPKTTSVPVSTPPQQQTGSSFGEAVKSGIGLGVGMEAVRTVTGMMGSNSAPQQHNPSQNQNQNLNQNPCLQSHDELMKCLNEQHFNCYDLLNSYNACLKTHQQN